MDTNLQNESEDFKPRGAITFFILLMILSAAIWFSIYFIMLNQVN